MTSDEIVKALRLCTDKTEHCEECHTGQSDFSFGETVIDCCERMNRSAADLIESLQSQLAEKDRHCASLYCETVRLQSQLTESQRREQAAINDLVLHGGCPSCKFKEYCEAHDMKKLNLDITTHRIARCVNYEWRGEKGVEK